MLTAIFAAIKGFQLSTVLMHNFKRLLGVLVVAFIIIAPFYITYQKGYKKGYAIGSSKPTNTFTAPSTVHNYGSNPKDRPIFIGPKLWRFGIGIIIDKE